MKRILILVIALSIAIVAAGSAQNKPAEANHQGMPMMMNAPMMLEGTSVTTTDTPDGITVTFTTKPENVTELRRRVRAHTDMMQKMTPDMMHGMMHGNH
jgi:hypothetical protein